MSEEEINSLPVHKYKVSGSQRYMSKISYLNIREYSNITFPISVSTVNQEFVLHTQSVYGCFVVRFQWSILIRF